MSRRHGTARVPQRLSRRHERYLYLSGTVLLLSGAGWLVAHYLLRSPAALGAGPHPAEPWLMRLHGAAVIGFLLVFGALLPGHVVQNWRQRLNRYSGLTMVAAVTVLALTGYGLYYLVDERQRAWTSALHWVVGLGASAALLLHVVLGRRLAAQARERRMAARAHHHKTLMPRGPYVDASARGSPSSTN
jgi:cation transport ATPase